MSDNTQRIEESIEGYKLQIIGTEKGLENFYKLLEEDKKAGRNGWYNQRLINDSKDFIQYLKECLAISEEALERDSK